MVSGADTVSDPVARVAAATEVSSFSVLQHTDKINKSRNHFVWITKIHRYKHLFFSSNAEQSSHIEYISLGIFSHSTLLTLFLALLFKKEMSTYSSLLTLVNWQDGG